MMASPIITELEVTKKLVAFGERAAKKGLDLSVDLQPCIDNPDKMQRLVRYIRTGCPSLGTGVSYDAATVGRILGLPCECTDPAPKAGDDEVVVWYGGWTLGELVATDKVVNSLSKEREAWKASAGYYHVRIPVPGSNRMTHDDRIDHLARLYPAFRELPTPVGATALAVHLGINGEDLLKGNLCFCAEALPDGRHAVLYVVEGRVFVYNYWDDNRDDSVFLGAARKSDTLKS